MPSLKFRDKLKVLSFIENGKPIDQKEICEKTNYSLQQIKKIVGYLCDSGVLKLDGNTCFLMVQKLNCAN